MTPQELIATLRLATEAERQTILGLLFGFSGTSPSNPPYNPGWGTPIPPWQEVDGVTRPAWFPPAMWPPPSLPSTYCSQTLPFQPSAELLPAR